jgi:flagellar biosynthesis/type III secretory pathway chaperone
MRESTAQKERSEHPKDLIGTETKGGVELPSLCDALLTTLKREIAAYENIFDAVRHEQSVLAKPSPNTLMESNSRKEEAILGAKNIEDMRQSIVRKLADALRLPTGQVHLSMIANTADPGRKAALRQCQADLTSLLVRIRDLNDHNRNLIEASISCVRNSMELITTLMTRGGDYVKTGQLRSEPLQGRILSREG